MTRDEQQRFYEDTVAALSQGDRIAQLEAALRKARHDLWLFAENSTDDDGTIRGEVAIRMIDEALGKAGASHV